MQYVTDTTGGNSGSPVIWENTGQAVGIHTHGGCGSSGGQNSGTSSTHPGLQAALADPQGICAAGIALPDGPPAFLSPTQLNVISAQVNGNPAAGSARLNYRFGPGAFEQVLMTDLGGGLFEAGFPQPACDESPEFFLSVVDTDCGILFSPELGPTAPYRAEVADAVLAFADDFQSEQGWVTSSNAATTGFWERAQPVNDPNWAYDPQQDADGSGACYLTQNEFGNSDVDNGSVTLTSPVFAWVGGAAGFLRYDYYLNLNSESSSDSLVAQLSSSGISGPWTDVRVYTADNGTAWTEQLLTLSDLSAAGLSPSSDMRIRFTATDGGAGSVVEAGIDGFQVGSADCSSNIGTNFCVPGSFGSQISAVGTSSVALNNLLLAADTLPFANGIFLYGGFQTQVPFGQGFLCVTNGGSAFRLPFSNAGAGGVLSLALDLTSPPNPLGQILPGSSWNFQAWFRVPGGFDLSDGLSIAFTP